MKRKTIIFTFMILATIGVRAYDFKANELCYNIISENEVEVTYENNAYATSSAYLSLTGDVNIPANVTNNGTTYTVTKIGFAAFYYCSLITSVSIPNSVTEIESWAFTGCSFSSIIIPSNVTKIGASSFAATALTSITIPSSVTHMEPGVFAGCSALQTINVERDNNNFCAESGILFTSDKSVLIQYPAGKTEVTYTIPNTVTTIASGAFSRCSALTSVYIPNSVINIGENAFSNCTALAEVAIPNSIKTIGRDAFSSTALYNEASNWLNGILYIDNCLIEANNDLSGSCEIAAGTKLIAGGAFSMCRELTSVTIPNSVITIGRSAFWSCKRLASISIPSSVITIEDAAFFQCVELNSIIIPNSVITIGNSAFANCYKLTSVTIGSNVSTIGTLAFSNCEQLTDLNILPNTPPTIYASTFDHSLNPSFTITLPNGSYDAYMNNPEWKRLLENSTTPNQLCGDNLYWTFDRNNGILTILGDGNMYDFIQASDIPWYHIHSLIKKVELPDALTNIGSLAFYDCTHLSCVDIPNSVTSIGELSFAYCNSLTSVTIPYSVTYIGKGPFASCKILDSIYVEASNNNYCSKNGVLFTKDQTSLIQYPAAKAEATYIIPNNVTNIEGGSFLGCENLITLTLPQSVTNIGNSVFYGCTSLTTLDIPASITNIGEQAFAYCTSLTTLDIPESVSEIKKQTFAYCTSLNTLNIPIGLTKIGEQAFVYCSSLTTLDIPESVSEIGQEAFKFCISLNTLNIPVGVTNIEDYTFFYCENLITLTIPQSVTNIGEQAFAYCTSLTTLNIPENVNIGFAAFAFCTSLTSITAHPTTPPSIEYYTFINVDKTIPVYVPEASIELYRTAPFWEEFTNFRAISESTNITQTSAEQHIYPMKDKLCNPNAQAINIYDIQGKIVYSGDDTEISLPMHGIYIIETVNGTQKVMF